ncbi:MAG: 3-deoxy-manno-octulosonate cytidylyltransferase [Bacteroidetes bacterium]|nr:3-deoxy-manno-octulosonate cytidylyltransferase [Bacteroidota bacterium]
MKFCILIPARYGSTRFPGKPLADLGGMSIIQRVWVAAASCSGHSGIAVATDDVRIESHVNSFGKAIITDTHHPSGTDRCMEAYEKSGFEADVVVNLQGDEPFIKMEQIMSLASMFENPEVQIATLMKVIKTASEVDNSNVVKVVTDIHNKALYFSRSRIPFSRENDSEPTYYRHIGMYAYRTDVLGSITRLRPSRLELTEKLEQLRWLENGYHIAVAETGWQSPAVDTPEDLEKAKDFLTNQP